MGVAAQVGAHPVQPDPATLLGNDGDAIALDGDDHVIALVTPACPRNALATSRACVPRTRT